jgi:hypothetical protein
MLTQDGAAALVAPDLARLLASVLAGAYLWAQKHPQAEAAVADIRHEALLLNHRRYVEHIPLYRRFAEDCNVREVHDVDELIDQLLFSCDLFKSYDPRWLAAGDYRSMTDWLGSICVRRPATSMEGVGTLAAWFERLRAEGIHVTHSSGTGGRLSFVPRDALTFDALVGNGRFYAHTPWNANGRAAGNYDCLILGPRGSGMGIQGAAAGLAHSANRSHFLFDAELNADILHALGSGGQATVSDAAARFLEETVERRGEAYAGAFEFLRTTVDEQRRVMVFGTPFQMLEACSHWLSKGLRLRLAVDSLVVTGGGWKSAAKVEPLALQDTIERSLGVPPDRVLDVYSTSECNCVLMRCSEGRYHVPPVVEMVAVDDLLMRISGNDVHGMLAILDPFALSYPGFLLTGDEGRLVRGACACGLDGWAVVGEIRRASGQELKGCAGVMASVLA